MTEVGIYIGGIGASNAAIGSIPILTEALSTATGAITLLCNPLGIGILGVTFLSLNLGSNFGKYKIKNTEKEETIKAIKNSLKTSIEITTTKILDQYKKKYNSKYDYDLIEGSELLKLIEDIKEKIIRPKEESFTIMDLFENFIYGYTPLCFGSQKAFEIFQNREGKKILFIISDGLLNDIDKESAQEYIKIKSNLLEVITICIYLNSSNKLNQKSFYNEIQSNFDEGAKFLFNISSKLNYHNNIIKFFIKKNWDIPLNGTCKLFIEINNSEDLNQFINLINESIDKNESVENVNKIIGDSLLENIIDKNYIGQFKSEE